VEIVEGEGVPAEIHPLVLSPKALFVSVWGQGWVGELLNVKATFGRRIHSGDIVGDFSRSIL
jgi:hypothetical protein